MNFNLGIAAALVATSAYVVGDTASKYVSEFFGNRTASIAIMGVGILPAFIALLIFGAGSMLNAYQIGLIALSAFFLAAGYLLVYKSLETEQISNTLILFESVPVVLVLFGFFALSESITVIQSVSMLAIFFGALCVTTNVKQRFNKKLFPAIIGMILWAFYAIPITYAIKGSGEFILPILAVKIFSFVMVAAYLLLTRPRSKASKAPKRISGKAVLITLGSGLFDGIGMLVFGYVFLGNAIALAGAINSMGPAFEMFLGRMFYKDRWTKLQFAGLVVMVVGAIALSL
jgi:drug/metabolite transporter (DMT)-like permease